MEKFSEEIPFIIAQGGPLNGLRHAIKENLTIGRDSASDLVIPDRQVSRFHARLTPTSLGVELEDLDSKNGSFLNGNPLKAKTILQDGDVFQIALVQAFAYISSDATIPLDSDKYDFTPETNTRLILEKRSRRITILGQEIVPPLSLAQFKLLECLYDEQNRVVPRNVIIERIWDEKEAIYISDQALDALVRRLRERLAEIDPSHEYVITIRGHGLRLENPNI
jgi:DNA-binding winged helix-turn-helix (wHTH) protein